MRDPRGLWFRAVLTLVLALCLSVGAASSRAVAAAEPLGAGAWLIGLELQQRSFDTMSAGDARPLARGDAGVRVSIERLLTPHWGLGASAHFGGSWFDWSDQVYNISGKIEDAAWDTRLGVDRAFPVGACGVAFAGLGVEYGEARSWLHTLGVQQDLAEEGPRCYRTGGYVRLGAMTPMWRRTAVWAQISTSVYGAHASDPPFGTQFNWLGRSLAVSAGLRFEIAHGRAASAQAQLGRRDAEVRAAP